MTRIAFPWKRSVITLVFLAGCNGPSPLPSTPSGLTPGPPPAPAPQGPVSSASVTVENPFAIVRPIGSKYGYAVRFLLRETSGASGATIERIVIHGPSGSDEAGPSCWRDALRVPPKGELDTFYTDAGAASLSYCGPGAEGNTATPTLDAVVMFRDDNGVAGSVAFQIPTLR
jgi:hypothetical protein